MSPDIKQALSDHFRALGKKGGTSWWTNLSEEEKTKRIVKMVKARQKNRAK